MRKFILTAALVAAACLPSAVADPRPVEGCQAVSVVIPYCNYLSTGPGNILGVGSWKVVVHWSGDCGPEDIVTHGENGWIRSSADGGNNVVPDLVGAWGGTVHGAGYCVEAFAGDPDLDGPGAVLVGAVLGQVPPEM